MSDRYERLGPRERTLTDAEKAACPPELHWYAAVDLWSCDVCGRSEVDDIMGADTFQKWCTPLIPMFRDTADNLVVCQRCMHEAATEDEPMIVEGVR